MVGLDNIDPADFVGHLVWLEDVKITKDGKIRVTLDLPLNRDLLVQMAEHRGERIFAGFGFMQPKLPLATPDQPPADAPKAANDEPIIPHKFRQHYDNPAFCLFCKRSEGHEIHDGVIASRPATADEQDALAALNANAAAASAVATAQQMDRMAATV